MKKWGIVLGILSLFFLSGRVCAGSNYFSPADGTVFPTATYKIVLRWISKPGFMYAVRVMDHTNAIVRMEGNNCPPGDQYYACVNGLPDGTASFVVRVSPGHEYSWWLHEYEEGYPWTTPIGFPRFSVQRTLLEPPDGESFFGFVYRTWENLDPAYGDTRLFPERYTDSIQQELGGRIPLLISAAAPFQETNGIFVPFAQIQREIEQFEAVTGRGVIPQVRFLSQTGWDNGSPGYSGITVRDVTEGRMDEYIRSYARDVAAYGRPIFMLPLCGEFNGTWWRSCSPDANSVLTKEDFVRAWQRVVDIFRGEGATNVAWLWVAISFPSGADSSRIDDVSGYYPGNAYVDWVGVDHYDFGPPSNMDGMVGFARERGKPVFVAEWGVRHSSSSLKPYEQEQWLRDMFRYFNEHPEIKAHLYFNMSGPESMNLANNVFLYDGRVNYRPNVNDSDHRLIAESGANFRGTFAGGVAGSRYRDGNSLAPVLLSPAHGVVFPAGTHSIKLIWNAMPGSRYALRVVDHTDSGARTEFVCPAPEVYVCAGVFTATSFVIPVNAGHEYSWWVHAVDEAGRWSEIPVFPHFSVSAK
ncbi:MAG: hypothetical protein Q7R73_05600 [bacterium]|nr:hypothetical protein [bacterium]